MEADENSAQVRRTARARKVNPKFFGDETGYDSYMRLVKRINAPNYTGISKDDDNLSKDSGSDDKQLTNSESDNINHDGELNSPSSAVPPPIASNCNDNGSINIALKTVSLKKSKKSNSTKQGPSVIIRCRSSTESEMSEDSVIEGEKKRKIDSSAENETKKLKVISEESNSEGSNSIGNENSHSSLNSNIKVASLNSPQLLQKAYVSLPISNNLEKFQPKIVLGSQSKFNLPGKKLKIVSLKPITIKQDNIPISFDSKSPTSPENYSRKLVLEGGPVELKIVKKEVYPVCSSSLPPIIGSKGAKDKSLKSSAEKSNDENVDAAGSWFSSDGEDDIPLNKLLVKEGVDKKKKKKLKNKTEKTKIKKVKGNKTETDKKTNDQDDLPLKVLIKKSKSLSKGLSDKFMNTIRKKKAKEAMKKKIDSQDKAVKVNSGKKKRKMNADESSLDKDQPPMKMKIKSDIDQQDQKVKNLVMKKKRQKLSLVDGQESKKLVKKMHEKKLKRLNKLKATKSDLNLGSFKNENEFGNKNKIKDGKTFQKLRFKFPKKISKSISEDTPLSNETTNVVISVSGIEGDYACVAIPKPEDPESEYPKIKSKLKRKRNSESSLPNKYTFDSGLVLEDVSIETNDINLESKVETSNLNIPKGKFNTLVKSEVGINNSDATDKFDLSEEDQKCQKERFPPQKEKNSYNAHPQLQKSNSKTLLNDVSKDSKDILLNEGNSKLTNLEKKETDKSKEKERKKEEKVKLNAIDKVVDIDVDKIKKLESEHKKHKLNRKDSSSSMSYSTEGIKTEERSIKKEKNENSKKVGKESTDNKTEKLERDNKESSSKKMDKNIHSSNRLEREDSKHNLANFSKKSSKEDKLDSNNSPKKMNKEALSKIVDKEIVKIEKEATKEDSREAVTPLIKVKKKENFEEALLNIPLPKLSKHKKDRDKKDKEDKYKNYVKEKKYDVKQEMYLIKHRENDNEMENSKGKDSLKSPVKIDKSNIKLESHSKDIKKEDRGHHREERRHSSSGRRKSERRRSEYDSKESIKFHGDSSFDEGDKRRKDDKRRSSHSSSHKKHKKDHDSHRGHSSSSSSSDKRKHRSEETSKLEYKSFKEKLIVKSEDRKDLIINKIIDGAETNDIKREQEYPNFNLVNTKSETPISESELMLNSICPKNEMKAEVIIDEEHLVSVGKGSLKEEDDDDETITVSSVELKPETVSQSFPKEEVSALSSDNESKITLRKELSMETTKTNIENKENEDFGAVKGDEEIRKSLNNTFVIEQKEDDPVLVSETDVKIYHTAKVNVESDLGILDELRTLKQMSAEERMKSEIQFNKDEIEERINTSVNQVNEQNIDLDKAEVDKKSDLEEIFGENENSPIDISLNLEQETDEVETKKDTESVDKSLESADDSDVPPSDVFTAGDSQKEEINVLMSDSESSSEQLVENNQMDDNNKSEGIMKEAQHNYISNSPVDMLKTESGKSITLSSDIENEKSNELQTPLSLIPLPSEDLETDDIIMNPQSPPSPLSPESTPMSPSEPDEGFSEASSHTRELISSEEEKISPEVSDDEDQPTEDVQLPVEVKELTPEEKEELERRNKQIVEERMNAFEHLSENLYLAEKVRNKRSKEARRMVCDCMLTKEEIANGDMGCADDCLNKLLMIECGSRCPLKDRCMNKKFQQKDYSGVEVFNAEEKGCGVRSCQEIKQGTFIMEYIGEVFDTREFKRRRKDYAKGGSPHFYFMALSNDRLIDATRKGNISRFVNHSCSPNAETQKWTVNGDVRVGFFSTKNIPVGEEITFDYRLERYGREPQRCYCGTPECRGWLGEPPDKKTKEEKEEDRRRELKDKQKREAKRFLFEDMDLEDEIDKLTVRGLRNRQDTLDMSRLMVRCEDSESRLLLLKILESGEEASKRLFLDYHGLKLLWSWMVDISSSHKCIPLKLEILKTLNTLPITNKTQITDSKVLNIVERWSKLESKIEKNDAKLESDTKEVAVQDKKLSDGSDSDTETSETKDSDPSPSDTISPDDSSQDSNEVVETVAPIDKEEAKSSTPAVAINEVSVVTEEEDTKITDTDVASLASNLLSVWSELKEAFKIPKKERIEMMKEHEREVDKEYEKYMDRKGDDSFDDRKRGYYESWRYNSGDRDSRDQRDRERRRDRRWSKWKDYYEEDDRGLSKEERRERFAKKVAKEDEEARQRKLQEEMWNLHLERCGLLGHDPYFTPIFDPSGQYYWDPSAGTWQAYIGPSGNLPVPASYGMNRPEGNENICPNIPTNQMFVSGAFYPLPHTPVSDEEGFTLTKEENPLLDLASIPLPGETPQAKGISPSDSPGIPIPLTGAADDNMDIDDGSDTPDRAPPGPVTIKLPQKWKIARDNERNIYFYHTKTRHTQWDLPADDIHAQLMIRYGLTSDSESDLESDSDSSTSSDSEDFSSDEDENEEEEVEADPVKKIENEFDEKMIRRQKGKKIRSERLVQERVISPILFRDREAARRERKEAKERARVEARKERMTLLKTLKGGSVSGGSSSSKKSDVDIEKNISLVEDAMSPNENEDDEHLEEQLQKFARRQKSDGKHKAKSKERAATALADTSDIARKIKDSFRSRMATYIVSVLNPYRKGECKEGRITSNEDFKYLARKLTHFVMVKELKQLPSIDGLECSESVKHKTKEFVRKYMSKYGGTFKRDPNDTKEY